jgi:hypothetical protein
MADDERLSLSRDLIDVLIVEEETGLPWAWPQSIYWCTKK